MVKVKVKVTLVQAPRLCTGRTTHSGSRGIALHFHDHGSRRGWGVSVTPRPLLPPENTRYPLYRRHGGPQGRSGQVREISPQPGFDPRTVQPVASRYTEWDTRPTECSGCIWGSYATTLVKKKSQSRIPENGKSVEQRMDGKSEDSAVGRKGVITWPDDILKVAMEFSSNPWRTETEGNTCVCFRNLDVSKFKNKCMDNNASVSLQQSANWKLSSHGYCDCSRAKYQISWTFRHRASCILRQAFHYSPENAFYIFNQQIYFIIWYLLDRASLI